MPFTQSIITFSPRSRGFHVVTEEVLEQAPALGGIDAGLFHLFLQHTSASLTINENASPAVRGDMERHFNQMVPEDQPYYEHTLEGSDDMPAHIKASLLSTGLMIPIRNGALAFGTWQGIYLNEHRDHGGARTAVATVMSG